MNVHEFTALHERLKSKQAELFDHLTQDPSAAVTPALERLLHILDWVRLEHYMDDGCGQGRPPRDHFAIANAFMSKAVLGISTTVGLIERLQVDKTLRRLCGFSPFKKLPNESTFSRVFAQLAERRLLERVHAELITSQLGEQLIGHISRDGTAITAREKPQKKMQTTVPAASSPESRKRGRPRAGEVVKTKPPTQIAMQMQQTAAVSLAQLPTACDRGTKCTAQGYKNSWNGYKLHMDTTDCGVPISVVLTSASVHDSQVAVPLSQISAQRVTSLYDVMDAAYCSEELRQHSRNSGHVPLIDHNPRNGTKRAFDTCEAQRYKERTVAERMNARLKDEFGASRIYVRTHSKVMCHLMFGILALCADQIMRLLR